MSQQATKVRGVADIVFLVDVTGSMGPCISALRENIGAFIETLASKDANNSSPVQDWRGRVIGYRDFLHDKENWFVNNPFVSDASAMKSQLAALKAEGGGDEPESLLEALCMVSDFGSTDRAAPAENLKWRHASEAIRFVVAFTDASYHPIMSIPNPHGHPGELVDAMNKMITQRIRLSIYAPELPCYEDLSALPKSVYEAIPLDGRSAQDALKEFTANKESFKRTLEQLAKSLSHSSFEVVAD